MSYIKVCLSPPHHFTLSIYEIDNNESRISHTSKTQEQTPMRCTQAREGRPARGNTFFFALHTFDVWSPAFTQVFMINSKSC